MNKEVRNLEPNSIWNNFADLNAVPRASKKEEKVRAFMVEFGKSLGLETEEDEIGNVLIRKPASQGMEDRKTVVLQSHLDMVHQKNADTDFDFDTQGIQMYVDGDWVRAKGTTLGADNGLGVAAIMTLLQSSDIPHPPLEALFTIDEETGMTGALGLKGGWLTGDILLNLDTEEDDEIGVGCAGGIDVTTTGTYELVMTVANTLGYKISITGLNGGHSGIEIHKGLGNANKIMGRILYHSYEDFGLQINEVNGGSLRNAIPRECFAKVAIDADKKDSFMAAMKDKIAAIKKEFKTIDPELSIEITSIDVPREVMDPTDQELFTKVLQSAHNGVFRMSPDIPDLVETSNNVAKVTAADGEIEILCLTRSSVESSKQDMVDTLTSTFEMASYNVETSGDYPGWTPNMDSSILKVLEESYDRLHDDEPHVAACHAGLECGILGTNYPQMEMISFGPMIKGAHSPDERASISSTQKFWNYLKDILVHIPMK